MKVDFNGQGFEVLPKFGGYSSGYDLPRSFKIVGRDEHLRPSKVSGTVSLTGRAANCRAVKSEADKFGLFRRLAFREDDSSQLQKLVLTLAINVFVWRRIDRPGIEIVQGLFDQLIVEPEVAAGELSQKDAPGHRR